MRELSEMYAADTSPKLTDLPPLPPVSHMELGRQEPLNFAFHHRDPFACAVTNVVAFPRPEPVTLESVKAAVDAMLEEVGPLPPLLPFEDPDYILAVPTPEFAKLREGITIYWTDSRGQTWGPHGRVG